MNHFTYLALAFSTVIIINACSSPEAPKTVPEKVENCTYTYDHSSSVLEWTAYKFTDKTEVKGTFTRITMKDGGAAQDPKRLIQSLSFTIPTSTIETQNPERDAKIAQFFFGTSIETITGNMGILNDDGTVSIEITMNDVTKKVPGTYMLEDGNFAFQTTIDVADWNMIPGLNALNKVCRELHRGPDKVSKLWSEVDLLFTTNLKADCE